MNREQFDILCESVRLGLISKQELVTRVRKDLGLPEDPKRDMTLGEWAEFSVHGPSSTIDHSLTVSPSIESGVANG